MSDVAEASEVFLRTASENRMRRRFQLRVVALGALAVVCAALPTVGDNRFLLGGLLVGLMPVPVLMPQLVSARRLVVGQSLFDVMATVFLIGFVPGVWAAGLVIVVCAPTASSALLGRKTYVALEVLGLAGLGVAAHVSGAQSWQVPLLVAALMVPLVASYVEVFLAHELTAAAQLDEVASSSSAVFWEVDARTGEFIGVSGHVEQVLGHRSGALPDTLPGMFLEEDQRRWWELVLDSEEDQFVIECRSAGPDGATTWLRLHVRRVAVRGRHLLRGIAFDITELAEAQEEVRRRAETDHLTGLANRFVLVRGLQERFRTGRKFSLHILDLDRFKDINDTLGHQAGDDFLQVMAARLVDAIGNEAIVARMGGDEFAVVVDSMGGGLDSVIATARQLVAACERSVEIAGVDFAGSASCGVAVAPIHGSTAEDLLRRADLAMYAAKRSGVGVHLFEFSVDEAKVSRLKLSTEAEGALASGQMQLWFQPKIELATGRVAGAEALLRWHHPERGVLLPADFLDIVELSRHRKALCETVIGQGIAFIARTQQDGRPLAIAVNVSIRDLLDPDFADMVTTQLERASVPATSLTLEITERDLMDDRTGFLKAAEAARATGVALSIDDFGTGHSSLLRLHQLPVNELKIDRSFVTGLGDDPAAKIIVKSIIELGRSLGHRVVAEGIERANEADLLRSLGCDFGQGYLYSPALPADEFMAMLAETPAPALQHPSR